MKSTPIAFEEHKAAQVAAFFAAKDSGEIDKLKLIKLMYLSEREYLLRHAFPMLFDEVYSLPHGPICSSSLDGINLKLSKDIWGKYLNRISNKKIGTGFSTNRDEYDWLNDAEIDVLNSVWDSFGFMSGPQLRNYTHKNCPEYTEVGEGNRMAITFREIFEALGVENPEENEDRIVDFRRAHNMLTS